MNSADTAKLPSFSMGGLTLRPFPGHKLMVLRVEGHAGDEAVLHAHEHEQISLVVSGRVRFRIEDEEKVLGPGEVVHVPSGAQHGAVLLEDSLLYDLYHPVRDDMLSKIPSGV